jgi:hypothetical protein
MMKSFLNTQSLLNDWQEVTTDIQASIEQSSHLSSYLTLMNLMLLKHQLTLEYLSNLSCSKQKLLLQKISKLKEILASPQPGIESLSHQLESLNLVLS